MQSFKKALAKGEPSTRGEVLPDRRGGHERKLVSDRASRNVVPARRALSRHWSIASIRRELIVPCGAAFPQMGVFGI